MKTPVHPTHKVMIMKRNEIHNVQRNSYLTKKVAKLSRIRHIQRYM